MAKYKGFYKDHHKEVAIEIYNDFETLSFDIGKLKFRSQWLDDIQLINYDSFTADELQEYSFHAVPILLADGTKSKSFDLYDCSIEMSIPQIIVDNISNIKHEISLDIVVTLGCIKPNGCLDKLQLDARFSLQGIEYTTSTSQGDFETIFYTIQKQLGNNYYLKNCFGCLYSDYSPYGQTFFGGMHCFVDKKEEYLKVENKDDMIELGSERKEVQEIYCCNRFCKRIKGTGYRG